jgi:RNA polymerase sigma factor (sigma-70 family)
MHAETNWKTSLQKLHGESYLWSLSCCNFDEHMAKDVLQTVYLKIYDGRASYNKKSTLKTWLFSVIKFTSVDFMRKQKTHPEKLNDTHQQIAEPERITETDNHGLFVSILQSLSGQQREVLTLAFYHDLTLEAIADLLELSIGSVRTHYERGKENFKKRLTKYKIDTELP